MEESHPSENLASEINMKIDFWNIRKKMLVVISDNDSNITNAIIENLQEISLKTTIALIDHRLPVLTPNQLKISKELCIILEPFEAFTNKNPGKQVEVSSSIESDRSD